MKTASLREKYKEKRNDFNIHSLFLEVTGSSFFGYNFKISFYPFFFASFWPKNIDSFYLLPRSRIPYAKVLLKRSWLGLFLFFFFLHPFYLHTNVCASSFHFLLLELRTAKAQDLAFFSSRLSRCFFFPLWSNAYTRFVHTILCVHTQKRVTRRWKRDFFFFRCICLDKSRVYRFAKSNIAFLPNFGLFLFFTVSSAMCCG